MCSGNNSRGHGGLFGDANCGINCWLAKYPDPEDIEGEGGWYKAHTSKDFRIEVPGGWYDTHKNLTGPVEGPGGWYDLHRNLSEDVDSWYARQPSFDLEAWFQNHSNIHGFSWDDWIKEHVIYLSLMQFV